MAKASEPELHRTEILKSVYATLNDFGDLNPAFKELATLQIP